MKTRPLLTLCASVLLMALLLALNLFALGAPASESKAETITGRFELFDAIDIQADLEQHRESGTTSINLEKILLEPSLDIEVPNINLSKVKSPTKIADLAAKDEFYKQLDDHGVQYDPDTITYSEYCIIESTWTVDADTAAQIRLLYPELENTSNTELTYGDYLEYQISKDKQDFGSKWFTPEQLDELEERNIRLDDAAFLLKEFHNAEVILRQSDAVLKQIITDFYNTKLNSVQQYAQMQVQSAATSTKTDTVKFVPQKSNPITVSLTNSPDLSKYTYVYFPQYNNGNGDYFHNDVLTTMYWMVRQANRARRTQSIMYNTLYSQTVLQCTNMYGTYSYSQGGTHEGIDFAAAYGTVNIYSPTWGIRIATNTYHQFSVYDANHADGPKTYSYLHLSYLSPEVGINEAFGVTYLIGRQGQEGNADGYHVHFEVHNGNTPNLSLGNNDVLGSISPYRLTQYIGEGDPLPGEEQYW